MSIQFKRSGSEVMTFHSEVGLGGTVSRWGFLYVTCILNPLAYFDGCGTFACSGGAGCE